MWIKIIKWAGAKALNKWIIGGVIAVVLGSGGLMWHNYKQGLRDEGQQKCVQAINEQTVIDLADALAEERQTSAELARYIQRAAQENATARARLEESKSKLNSLLQEIQEQKNNDKEYAEWSDTPLPDDVADRVREAAGRSTHPGNEDGN